MGGGEDQACDGEGGVFGVLGLEFGEGDGVVVELGGNVDLDGGLGHGGEGRRRTISAVEFNRCLQRDRADEEEEGCKRKLFESGGSLLRCSSVSA